MKSGPFLGHVLIGQGESQEVLKGWHRLLEQFRSAQTDPTDRHEFQVSLIFGSFLPQLYPILNLGPLS